MLCKEKKVDVRLDVLGLISAGLINTFLALFVAGVILGPGTISMQSDMSIRAEWIYTHSLRWQLGWLFWFAVTLSFAWSYYALGRHLKSVLPWSSLAIGVAVIAAAVDLIGVLVNIAVIPELADALISLPSDQNPMIAAVYISMENLAYALTNIVAFGLYTFAGLLLLPAVFKTKTYPRWLAWLGLVEWCIAGIATILLVIVPTMANGPLLVSFALYAPWVWGSAVWLLHGQSAD
jgi:hypothetical protein